MELDIYAKTFEEKGYSGAYLEALKLIGKNKRVLDLGCSTGNIIRAVQQDLGGEVDGIEIDPEAAKLAAKFARKVYLGSVEDARLLDQLHETYDVLLFMDILEHCKDPLSVLKNTRSLLSEEGCIIASVPNIANWRIRLSLLMGKFEYQEVGLLDKGHLRFFTLKTLKNLFNEAGYKIIYLDFTLGAPPPSLKSISKPAKNYLRAIFKRLTRFIPGLFANQFIVKAIKK